MGGIAKRIPPDWNEKGRRREEGQGADREVTQPHLIHLDWRYRSLSGYREVLITETIRRRISFELFRSPGGAVKALTGLRCLVTASFIFSFSSIDLEDRSAAKPSSDSPRIWASTAGGGSSILNRTIEGRAKERGEEGRTQRVDVELNFESVELCFFPPDSFLLKKPFFLFYRLPPTPPTLHTLVSEWISSSLDFASSKNNLASKLPPSPSSPRTSPTSRPRTIHSDPRTRSRIDS